jgi:hypothetical protein
MARVDELIEDWKARKASLRCSEVVAGLESLKFIVKSVGGAGHKTFSHPQLADFYGSSFDCGHGKNSEIKSNYIVKILSVLRTRRDELAAIEQGETS